MGDHLSSAARIEAVDCGWHYAGREKPAFSRLNFVIEPGQKVLLLGPSGAGKSTLLHAIGGIVHDNDGGTLQGSLTVGGLPPREARGSAGLMQQDPESSVVLSRVGDDVAFGPENLAVDPRQIWQRVEQSLAAVGLEDLALDRPTSNLSGGQKQRLGLAGILAMRPGALLLDEPTANLDPRGMERVRDSVLAAQRLTGATLVVVEHRVGLWAQHMDRVIVLGRDGGITHDGPPGEVLDRAAGELAEAGVWVPGLRPETPKDRDVTGEVLIRASRLSVTREYPRRKTIRARRRELAAGRVPRLDLPAVASGLDFDVRAGEHLSIVGHNGAGKSTLALTLAGLLYPAGGQLVATRPLRSLIPGQRAQDPGADIAGWSPTDVISRIGLVFQQPEQQFMRATVREELEFGPRRLARVRGQRVDEDQLRSRCDDLLDRLRLGGLEQANPFTLSGGEKRRLSVATALATEPRVLILDEPTFGQDANTWRQLLHLVKELLDRGTAVLSVTHDLDFARAVGGRALLLGGPKSGHVCEVGQL